MRLFRDEYMTGSTSMSGRRAVSALTLALFADSGWYTVDSSQARYRRDTAEMPSRCAAEMRR